MTMMTARRCNEELNASRVTMGQVWGEVREVIASRSLEEVKEEVADVLYFVWCRLESRTGIDVPMWGAGRTVAKVRARIEVWEELFAEQGLDFDRRYLVNGSNHERPEKVEKAFALARGMR